MNARDRHLVTWLVVLSDQLPPFVDQVLAAAVAPHQWNEFADMLAGTARLCRERGLVTLDIGDSGGR
jgi:hypothetical protein